MNILIVEDDPAIGLMLKRGLEDEDYNITLCDNGEDGIYIAKTANFDVIILDWMLPLINGIEVIRRLRNDNINTPILMLTAKGEIEDKVTGFRNGADDYLPKPFRFEELLVRLEALYRRSLGVGNHILREGDLTIDLGKKVVKRGDKILSLTKKEYQLLLYFIKHKNQTISIDMIYEHLWGESDFIESNVIQVTIYHLRQKIGKDKISTKRGVGYIFES